MSAGTVDGDLKVNRDLSALAPKFRAAVVAALSECAEKNLGAIVYEGFRSEALQKLYYARGRTVVPPAQPVTNASSSLYSWHGYGLAVDVIHRTKYWDAGEAWFEQVAQVFKQYGCRWGGEWQMRDLPHFQWGRCKPSPSDEARRIAAAEGIRGVWRAVGAADPLGLDIDEVRVNPVDDADLSTPTASAAATFSIDTNLKEVRSPLTAKRIDAFFDRQAEDKKHLGGIGVSVFGAEAKYGINASYIVAHAILETGWGRAKIYREKNNLFGWGAEDSDPYTGAKRFDSRRVHRFRHGAHQRPLPHAGRPVFPPKSVRGQQAVRDERQLRLGSRLGSEDCADRAQARGRSLKGRHGCQTRQRCACSFSAQLL